MANKRTGRSSRSVGAWITLFLLACAVVEAQELEPRAYSPSPIGTNFVLFGWARSSGGVLVDPTLPLTDVEATIDAPSFGYLRVFDLGGRAASLGILAPYVFLDATGNVGEEARRRTVSGLADVRLRFAVNFIGTPALSPREFAQRPPSTSFGASFTVVAPTGQYDETKLVNIGSNRWSFKPEIGVSHPIGKAFVEASGGVWLFTDNTDFFGGQTREQDPLWTFQLHAGYEFRRGMWLAGNASYVDGGRTSLDGVKKDDAQSNSRYGLTFSYPIGRDLSAKLAWSTGYTTRIGADFDTYAIILQYRWFD